MLKKRIIPCLDILDGRTVKGIQFLGLRDAGDPVELAKYYAAQGADELVFLDIGATIEKRKTLISLVEKIAAVIHIPFTVGGGIQTVDEAMDILKAGADKISINTAAIHNPNLISALAAKFGRQCVVVAIDLKSDLHGQFWVYSHGGRNLTKFTAEYWASNCENLGAGEILLTVMNNDGERSGFQIEISARISKMVNIPVIASGGAGKKEHFSQLFTQTRCTGALAASIFHFNVIKIPELNEFLHSDNIPIRIL